MEEKKHKHKLNTAQTAVLITILSFATKPIGFVRELLMANYYGAGVVADAYVMSQSIPNTLVSFLLGAIATAYMPIFSEKFEKKGIETANLYTSQIINFQIIIVAAANIFALFFPNILISWFAPGFSEETAELTIYYMRITFLLLFINAASGILDSYLKYRGEFIKQIYAGYVQSPILIIFLFLSVRFDRKLLIYGLFTGIFIKFILQYILVKKRGFVYSFNWNISDSVKDSLKIALPVLIGGSFGEINAFIDRILASGLPSGSVSAMNYAGFILGIIGTFTVSTLMTLIYPKLNQAFAQDNKERVAELAERGINIISVISVPFTLGTMVYSKQIIQVIYERGEFDPETTALTGGILMFYAIKLAFDAVNGLLVNVFYSVHDAKSTVSVGIIAVLINIILNLILVKVMGAEGLALATSISAGISMVIRYKLFRRKHPDIYLLRSKRKLVKICIFSFISVAASYGFYTVTGNAIWMPRMVLLGLSVGVAFAVYLAFLWKFKFEELGLLKELVKK